MKKNFLFITGILIITAIQPQESYALGDTICVGNFCTGDYTLVAEGQNCATSSTTCWANKKAVKSCLSCNSGYDLTELTVNISECSNEIKYKSCVKQSIDPNPDCDGTCENCEPTSWVDVTTGYQRRTDAICNTSTCICSRPTVFRCAPGYYGNPPAFQMVGNYTGCSQCPSSGGIFGSSAAGSTDITDCYIPAGTSQTDSTGTYTYTSNCYYSE